MAVTQLYTAVANDTITAARWNNEFGNIYNNGTAIAFPLTAAVSLAGYTITLDSAGVTTFISSASQAFVLSPGAKTGTPAVANGNAFDIDAHTFTDNNTAASGTATAQAFIAFARPTLAATNTSVTTTDATTMYIANAPAAGTNETITNAWALWVDAGNVRLDGNLVMSSTSVIVGGIVAGTLLNVGLTATVSGNALTLTLVGNDGAALSSSNRCVIPFRTSPVTTGTWAYRELTAAISLVITSGSTLGFANSQVSRIYIVAMDNAGTVVLGAYHPLSGTGLTTAAYDLLGLDESILYSSTAEGALGAADSAQTIYTNSAQTSLPIRILGYIDIATGSTAGQWGTAPSVVQVMAPGVFRTGDIIQKQQSWTGTVATGTTAIPDDTTVPQDNEGDEYMNVALTQRQISSLVYVHGVSNMSHGTVLGITVTLSDRASGATDTDAVFKGNNSNVILTSIPFDFVYQQQSLSAQTYRVRGGASSGTMTFNGLSGAVKHGNLYSHVIAEEIAL